MSRSVGASALALVAVCVAGEVRAGDYHGSKFIGIGAGFIRVGSGVPSYSYTYATPVAAAYSYAAPAAFSYAPPAAYGYAAPAAGYSYGAPAAYGYGAPAAYGYGAPSQGFMFPGGAGSIGDTLRVIDEVLGFVERRRVGGGVDSKEVEKVSSKVDDLAKTLTKIESRLDRLERDYKDLKVPEGITARFDKLDKDLNEIGKRIDKIFVDNPTLKK
jgi:hypothetical protein